MHETLSGEGRRHLRKARELRAGSHTSSRVPATGDGEPATPTWGVRSLFSQVLAVGGIAEKLLAAHRCGLAGVILPRGNEREVDEDLGEVSTSLEK